MAGSLSIPLQASSLKRKRSQEGDRGLESNLPPPLDASPQAPADQPPSTTAGPPPNESDVQIGGSIKSAAAKRAGKGKKAPSKPPKPSKRTPSAPLPDAFKRLSQTHRALNLVYTFCCTRKHFATTFDNIKKAVQAQLGQGRELTPEDVARVKVIVPGAVRFEYVDEAKLEVMTVGDEVWVTQAV